NAYSVWQLERLMDRKKEIQRELELLQRNLVELQAKATAAKAANDQARTEYEGQGGVQWQLLYDLESLITSKNPAYKLPTDAQTPNTAYLFGHALAELERLKLKAAAASKIDEFEK